jgi:hypothetical protein
LINNRSTLEMHHSDGFNVFELPTSRDNLNQICGRSLLLYFLPLRRITEYEGLRYPVKIRAKDGDEMYHTNHFVV